MLREEALYENEYFIFLFNKKQTCATALMYGPQSVFPQGNSLLPDTLFGHDADPEGIASVHVPLSCRNKDIFHQPHGSVQRQGNMLHILHIFETNLGRQKLI